MDWKPVTRDDMWRSEMLKLLIEIRDLLKTVHAEIDVDTKPESEEFICTRCGKRFSSAKALGGHIAHCKGGGYSETK